MTKRAFKNLLEAREELGQIPHEFWECSTLFQGCGRVWLEDPPVTCPCKRGQIRKAHVASFEDHHELVRDHVESWKRKK